MSTQAQSLPSTSSALSLKNIVIWALSFYGAYTFIMAGYPKLAGAEMMVGLYEAIGIGQWFRYFTGVLEIGSGIALLIPAIASFAALLLAATMIGAILTHLFIVGGSFTMPLILLGLTLVIAYARKDEARKLLGL